MDYHQIGRQGAARRGQARLRGSALAGALLSAACPAGATELAGAPLSVDRAASAYDCPDAPALAESAIALGSPPATSGPPLRLVVHFERGPRGYVARIEASGRKQGTRELTSAATTCASLAEATSVVLAVLTDLIAPPEHAPVLAPAVPVPPRTRAAEATPLRFALGPDFGVAYGLVGSAATGTASAAFRARYKSAELELGALWSTPHFEAFPPGIVSLDLLAGTALGCFWFGADGRATLGACAGLGLGSLNGSGHGYDHDGSASTLWIAGLAGLAAELRLRPHWACRLALSAAVPLGEDTFAIAPSGEGLRSARLAIWARFGPEYRFW